MIWLTSAQSRNTLLVLLLGRICSLFKQVCKKLCTLQVFLMLQLYLPLLENLFDSKADRQEHIVMVYAHILGRWLCRIYSVFVNMVLMGRNFHLLVRHVLCVSCFMNVWTRYSAEQRHVSQLRGDTSDLVIDDKEVTIFRTSSAGSRRRIRR